MRIILLSMIMSGCSYVSGDLGFDIGDKVVLKSDDYWTLIVLSEDTVSWNDIGGSQDSAAESYDVNNEYSEDDMSNDLCYQYRGMISSYGLGVRDLQNISFGTYNDSLYSMNVTSNNTIIIYENHEYGDVEIYNHKVEDVYSKVTSDDHMIISANVDDIIDFRVKAPICTIY